MRILKVAGIFAACYHSAGDASAVGGRRLPLGVFGPSWALRCCRYMRSQFARDLAISGLPDIGAHDEDDYYWVPGNVGSWRRRPGFAVDAGLWGIFRWPICLATAVNWGPHVGFYGRN